MKHKLNFESHHAEIQQMAEAIIARHLHEDASAWNKQLINEAPYRWFCELDAFIEGVAFAKPEFALLADESVKDMIIKAIEDELLSMEQSKQ